LPQPLPLPRCEFLAGPEMPEPYRTLLVHDQHMTVTMEEFHRRPVNVRVQQRFHQEPWYGRQILLASQGTEEIVQGGIVRINLNLCSPEVRQAILREDTPLGRILITHDVMRRIEITAYLRLTLDAAWQAWLECPGSLTAYARLGFIHCDDQPAIELFEIVRPGTRREDFLRTDK
jgi:chorismate-pyruvate lyase